MPETYQEAESQATLQPIELYEFTAPGKVYRYTSHSQNVEHDSEVYESIAIRRSAVKAERIEAASLNISMPRSAELVEDNAFGIPTRSVDLILRRVISGHSRVVWRGRMGTVSISGDRASVSVPSHWSDLMETPLPRVRYQRQCNHRLYDDLCQVDRELFKEEAAVSSHDGVNVTVSTVGSEPDQFFKFGELVHVPSGERRMIVDQVSTALELSWPIAEMDESDAVELFAGCDLSVETCFDKFANVENFGGTPFIPARQLTRAVRGIAPPPVEED